MAVRNTAPIPADDPIANRRRPDYSDRRPDPQEGLVSKTWNDFFSSQVALQEKHPTRVFFVELTGQNASIGATDMTDGTLTSGVYRLSFYARITSAAPVSSSLTIAFDWTDGGLTQTYTNVAITGNTTQTIQPNPTLTFRIDALSPVRYTTTYASVGGDPAMTYSLYISLEEVKA